VTAEIDTVQGPYFIEQNDVAYASLVHMLEGPFQAAREAADWAAAGWPMTASVPDD
jgi:hypothetical protein